MILTLAAALASLQAAPQEPVATDDPIVVTGRRPLRRDEIRHHVSEISQSIDGQLARFRDPVCPEVVGMPDSAAVAIVARIRRVAAEAGLPVARAGCSANVMLIVTPDSQLLVETVRRELPGALRTLEPGEIRQLLRPGQTERMWRLIEVANEDGAVTLRGPCIADSNAPCLQVSTSSITQMQTQQLVRSAVVVIEDDATIGHSLRQIADYVAMRALGGARAPDESPAGGDTILSLLTPGAAPPPSLTRLDLAYLTAVYRTRPTEPYGRRLGAIAAMMRAATAGPEDGAPSQP